MLFTAHLVRFVEIGHRTGQVYYGMDNSACKSQNSVMQSASMQKP